MLLLSYPTAFYFIQTLTTLNLSSNQIGAEGAQHLSDALLHNTVRQNHLFFLSLSLSLLLLLSYPTAFYFIQTLTTLNLYDNQIGAEGAQHLSDALLHNTVRQKHLFFLSLLLLLSYPTAFYFIQTLTTLDLSFNQIRAEGAKHLSDALLHNTVRQKHLFFLSLCLSLAPSLLPNCFLLHTDTHCTRPLLQSNRS